MKSKLIVTSKATTKNYSYFRYQRRFVIVASQVQRNSVLIPNNIGRECDLNNHSYCILERIGRSRYFGETTSSSVSLNDLIKDSKLLHYFRNSLIKNQLVTRQTLQAKIRGQVMCTQLFHLPRFHNIIRASNMLLTEQLFDFLKKKPNHIAEIDEVKKFLKVSQKTFLQLVKSRPSIFKYDLKCPYREIFPDATEEECFAKNKTFKTVTAVRLYDPDIDIYKCWHKEDISSNQDVSSEFLDVSKQKLNRTLAQQVEQKIKDTGTEGMSQHEVGTFFGLSRLSARSVMRRLQSKKKISSYLKDEGRQRVSR